MNKFLEEILEQPAALRNVLSFYTDRNGQALLEKAKHIIDNGHFEQVIFTGMGSSYFISHAASCFFNDLKIHSFAINASELLHYNLSLFERETLLICISQSGESYEIQQVLKKLPPTVRCIGIVNEENSTLARNANLMLPCKGGKEEMTSTKTYVVTTLVTFILGWFISNKWNSHRISQVEQLIGNIDKSLSNYQAELSAMLSFLGNIQNLQIIARGPSFSTANQSALMFKEGLQIPAGSVLGGEFRHGPMEMVKDGFKSILFAAKGKTFAQSVKMAEDINRFGGKVVLITNDHTDYSNSHLLQINIDEMDEYLFSILSVVPMQLFVDMYAKSRGFEAGSFSRGAKVTVTE
jgi:glucosamine--fructose-6-phosphate aminotransferase (isomerizing)